MGSQHYPAKDRAAVALKVIRAQFPETPEASLMFAVIERAVVDALAKPWVKFERPNRRRDFVDNQRDALEYLAGDMPHAHAAGVDHRWIHRVFRRYQLDFGGMT